MNKLVILLHLIAAGIVAQNAPAVSGRVLDPTFQPIAGSRVVLRSLSKPESSVTAQTDSSGRFRMDLVPNGTYYLEASKPGFLNVRYHPIRVRFSRPVEQEFVLPFDWGAVIRNELPGQLATLTGELFINGKPLAGVDLCAINSGGRVCTTTNEIGQYALQVRPGTYQVTVQRGRDVIARQNLHLLQASEYVDLITIEGADRR